MSDRKLDLSHPRRIHLVGMGGAGIGAIAEVLLAMGHRVSGSDLAPSDMLDRLRRLGAVADVGHDAAHISDANVVAASTAVRPDNPELVEAGRRGIPVLRRAELLTAICARRRTAAVAGTHGKTTTATMLALVLEEAGWAPSYLIGGDIAGVGSGARWDTTGEWLVVEADESDGTFLELPAEAALVTSVEPDHLDYWGDERSLREGFEAFLAAAAGPRVVCADDPGAAAAGQAAGPVVSYGTAPEATIVMKGLTSDDRGSRFAAWRDGECLGEVRVAVPGRHFAHNAGGALTMAVALGIDASAACAGLARYQGVARRFERRGEICGATLVDDYAHLPGEVTPTLAAAREGGWRRLLVVFQPHRYSRTASLWRSFADAFVGADVLVITDVYGAGEAPRSGVSGELIAEAVRAAHPEAQVHYVPERDRLAATVAALVRPGDLCLTLGAGDISRLPDELLSAGLGGEGLVGP